MIYFAQTPTGSIKIGCTDDVEARLGTLASHYRGELALLTTMEGGREREAEIHARFAHLRPGRTEQFRPAAELMAFIGTPVLVAANPETIEACRSRLNAFKPVRVDLEPAMYHQFRIEAAKEATSMTKLAKRIVEDWVARRAASGK